MDGTVYLMYHELEVPGRALCCDEAGYRRYVLSAADFHRQLRHLRESGFHGVSVTQALIPDQPRQSSIAITFDDGCESDLLIAAPLLRGAGFGATFFVVAGWIGRRGYLNTAQLRELYDAGFEIGCHSMSHRYLSDLNDADLCVEIVEAKDKLQQQLGCRIDHFSCPGGRWNRSVEQVAREAGYFSVSTSRVGANRADADRFSLTRETVLRSTSMENFARQCRAQGLWKRRAQTAVLTATKNVMGNGGYEKARALLLQRGNG